ncbi:hypothetical protein B1992_07255 [Pseudoxanthomonas broegbernensis]|uniref:DUF4136 domain-containing protein n=1 Tax=Pseudoxanthomonas broegbernensis TaxID=83619 RepID=A0A7V8GMU2_9GAMM|nr:hypothetical protein [Pseudoxanthomonas broegbernensis]KAF1686696.1 hypothetical protein B1992_07255 [Pseudoxanthomonas broegbernensis]MBB6063543.1 hypothetical protein [Pseudoxanthomonas broegbernensis]
MAVLMSAMPAWGQTPLQEFAFSRGTIAVEYERATSGEGEVARLAAARESMPVRVVVMGEDTPDVDDEVAKAYTEGLRALFADVARSEDGRVPATGYLAVVTVAAADEEVEGREQVFQMRQPGVSCRSAGNSVECGDFGGVAVPVGTRSTTETGKRVDTVIQFHRLDGKGGWVTVFEESYSLHYREPECRNGITAAAVLAGALAGQALSEQPRKIQFNSNAELLRCRK